MNEEIEKAAKVIQEGGVILYPTDTIWGLGCDPKNEEAVNKIMELKQRPEGKSLLLLVPDERILQRYVKVIPEICYDLIDMATRPLTIIYPQGQYVATPLLAEDGSIGVRLTKEKYYWRRPSQYFRLISLLLICWVCVYKLCFFLVFCRRAYIE